MLPTATWLSVYSDLCCVLQRVFILCLGCKCALMPVNSARLFGSGRFIAPVIG
jgi:hypothetical protein